MHAVVGDFEHHLDRLPRGGRRLVAFLGSTIGNLEPGDARRVPRRDRAPGSSPATAFLLGTDLVKDTDRLVAAYDDAAGVTAEFNRNVLRVLNRELDADFDADALRPRRRLGRESEWIEMRLRADARPARHGSPSSTSTVEFAAGEEMRTEISAKFTPAAGRGRAGRGLVLDAWWTDPAGDFALSLAVPGRPGPSDI